MQRRVLVLAMSALMVWGMVVPAMANNNPFYDVPLDHWAYDSVASLAEAGLIEGYPDGTFGGSRLFTRYEMAMVFARVLALFEAHIDAKIAEGIDVRTEDLALQVNDAMEAALEALAIAIQAESEAADAKAVADAALERAAQVAREAVESVLSEQTTTPVDSATGVGIQEAAEIAAEVAAGVAADIAADVAAGVAADISAGIAADVAAGIASEVAEEVAARIAAQIAAEAAADVAARVAADVAAQLIAEAVSDAEAMFDAMQQAVAESQEVAQAALRAVEEAKAEIEAAARAAAETADSTKVAASDSEAREIAGQALRGSELARVVARNASATASEAKALAEEARRIAETRGEDASVIARMAKLEASRAQRAVKQALSLAEEALTAAEIGAAEALQVAQEALEIANTADMEVHELFAMLDQIGVDIAELQDRPQFTLTDEAEAAIQEIAAQLYAQRLAELEAQAGDIAAEVAALAGKAISSEDAAGIARRVVAWELRKVQGDVDSLEDALSATQGEVAAIKRLLDQKVQALSNEIDALTQEFRSELEILGVRVADLEDRIHVLEGRVGGTEGRLDVAEGEIRDIRAELDRVRVSGVNVTTLERGHAPAFAKEDPRDPKSEQFRVPERTTWSNLLQLRLDAIPAEGVTARLGFDLLLDRGFFVEQDKSARDVLEGSKLFAELTTPGDVQYARLGYLEKDIVADGFNRYLVTEKGLKNAGNYGGYAELQLGSGIHDLFLLQNFETGRYATGVSSYYDVSDMTDLTLNFVREWAGLNSRTGVSGELSGGHEDTSYRALVVADLEESAAAVEANFAAPFAGGVLTASYDLIPEVWGDDARRLPFSNEKLDEVADRSYLQTRADIPVLGFTAWGQIGIENTELSNGLFERFTRFGLYDLDLAGIDVNAMHERIVDQDNDWTFHNHLILSTPLADWNATVHLHDRTLPADLEKHQMLSLNGPVDIILPLEARARFATSRTATPSNHMEYELKLADYAILPRVTVDASLVSTTNVLEENKDQTWLENKAWTDEDRFERSIGAAWEVTDRLTLSAGLGAVNSSVSGRETSQEAGIQYELGVFNGDLALGYGYKVVRDGTGQVDGTPRNTFSANFVRSVGGWTLNADGKYVLGGTTSEAGNDRDLVGELSLAYPVYSGADFTLDGKFVSSKGLKAVEYEAHRVTAGLRVAF